MGNKEFIKAFYDDHAIAKIKSFINGNARVERAWLTLTELVTSPLDILEIGCGIGDISWRMSNLWTKAHVIGVDVSPRSIELANQLFASERLHFHQADLYPKTQKCFDLIVMMDVYEHIEISERAVLHEAIKNSLSNAGKIFLSFPTPRHLRHLRENSPQHIQPIDEDIDVDTVNQLAKETQTELLLYKIVSVWNKGDYCHVVLGKVNSWERENDLARKRHGLKERVKRTFFRKNGSCEMSAFQRRKFVKNKLSIDFK